MQNYFNNAMVRWNTWNPNQIIFKSNKITKMLLPKENILSWTSKGDRDQKMCKKTGCKAVQTSQYNGQPFTYYTKENYKGVMVQLKDLQSPFPSANIDFIDWTDRKDSVGNKMGSLDVLVYLNSFHSPWEWVRCPKTGSYVKKQHPNVAPLEEGYRMCYGGQGDTNNMTFLEFQELIQITESIKNFLTKRVVPFIKGELEDHSLLVA